MRKFLLSSIVLFTFSLSIILFQLSCKKEATAQSNTSTTCAGIANIIITVNFLTTYNPNSTLTNENAITLEALQINNISAFRSIYDFTNVNSTKQKVYTFSTNISGAFRYYASIRKSSTSMDFVSTPIKQLTVVSGQTYNITILASDFL